MDRYDSLTAIVGAAGTLNGGTTLKALTFPGSSFQAGEARNSLLFAARKNIKLYFPHGNARAEAIGFPVRRPDGSYPPLYSELHDYRRQGGRLPNRPLIQKAPGGGGGGCAGNPPGQYDNFGMSSDYNGSDHSAVYSSSGSLESQNYLYTDGGFSVSYDNGVTVAGTTQLPSGPDQSGNYDFQGNTATVATGSDRTGGLRMCSRERFSDSRRVHG